MLATELKELKNQMETLTLLVHQYSELEWLSEPKLVQLLNVSKSSLLRLRKSGQLRGSTLGGRVFYNLKDVNKLLQKNSRLK
ncbi:MAG: helix-turn-helix domain-containing protein [Flavobacteriales bacterium]|nr:helix-turn-helix domain-containing protein [Flavobacteriales bacterium]